MKVGDLVEVKRCWIPDEFGVSGIVIKVERFASEDSDYISPVLRCRVAYSGGFIWQSPKELKKLNKI